MHQTVLVIVDMVGIGHLALEIGPTSVQSRPRVGPKSRFKVGPKLAQVEPRLEVGPKSLTFSTLGAMVCTLR